MTQHESLLRADADGVRTLTLSRAARRNALDSGLTATLLHAVREADADESVRVLLLAGDGPVFSAGADLGEFKGDKADPVAEERRSEVYMELLLALEQCNVTVVCAVNGAAIGMGAAIAISADITVMAEDSRLSYPEMQHGMVPSLVMPNLQRRAGRKPAFELIVLGEPLAARDALALGLANRVVPAAQLMESAQAIARTLAGRPRETLREAKRLFVRHAEMDLGEALRDALASSKARKAAAAAR